MLNQLSNLGVSEQERLARNPYLQASQQPSTKDKFLSGLASGLNRFAENKLAQMESAKKAKGWESLGLNPEIASFVSQQSPDFQKDFFNKLEGIELGSPQQQPQAQEMMPGEKAVNPKSTGVRIAPSKEKQKEVSEKFKATKEFRQSVLQSRKSARSDLKDLNRLEELSKSGKLDSAGWVEFLNNSGLDIPALMSEDSQEFQKIQQNFLKNAKQYFGGRISNYEVEQFLKTIPSLSQTPAGRQRVIANLKQISRGAEEYYKAYEEILSEHGGVPPYDIEEEIERRIEPRIDKISEQFKKELSKPVPSGQNRLITGLQAGAGKVVGNAGKLVKAGLGAAAGARLGSAAGPIGAVAGGALGGIGGLFI